MDELSENFDKEILSIKKDIDIVKKDQSAMKNTISKIMKITRRNKQQAR